MRRNDWIPKLLEVFEYYKNRPFKYGETDCCLFTADCCKAICGIDFMEKYRGKYKSKKGATTIIKSIDFIGEIDSYFMQKSLSHLQRGDLVAYNNTLSKDTTLAIYFNGYWAVTLNGLQRINIQPTHIWEVR